MQRTITLRQREQKRMWVLNRVREGKLVAEKAAEILELSLRQIRRLVASYRKRGPAALVHGNRGRQPKHRTKERIRQRVVRLAKTIYDGANQQHLTELLAEREGISLSRSTVRRILEAAGIDSPKKKRRRRHHRRRERRPQEGMLVQIDGSKHHWFGPEHPATVLITAEDDATGKVIGAVFRQQEDAHGYFLLMRQVVTAYGCPLQVYHDQHGIFQVNLKKSLTLEEQLSGEPDPTQFGRLLKDLGIGSIAASTPQAKGRVERVFGTFQDRLVLELKLADVTSLVEANQFLPAYLRRHNRRFAVPAAQPGTAYQPLSPDRHLEGIFSFQYRRCVGQDNTVRFFSDRLQILPDSSQHSYAGARVQVQQRLDGSLAVIHRGRCLLTKPAPPEAPVLRSKDKRWRPNDTTTGPSLRSTAQVKAVQPSRSPLPKSTTTHPWRRAYKTMKTPKPARRSMLVSLADIVTGRLPDEINTDISPTS
jgi:transposase